MHHTENQDDVLTALKGKSNIFLTGSAGSGKTYITNKFATTTSKNVALTATTGIAALNIGGETIHRFLGIGISTRPEDAGKIIGGWNKIKKSRTPWDVQRWRVMNTIDTIIIDEVSMLRRDQFELIDAVLSNIKENSLPFGGVQMVLVGDFLQLPPVVTDEDFNRYRDLKNPYCFQSDLWKQSGFESYNLTSNYRQGEGDFLKSLELIRKGQLTPEVEQMLEARLNITLNTTIEPVKLFAHKYKVETENLSKLDSLPEEKQTSKAILNGKTYDIEILKKDCPAEEYLHYCKGAQVMMITNHPQDHWVNGTMGVIETLEPLTIKLCNGRTVEVPKHSWERTVHKAVGDKVVTSVVAELVQYPFKLAYATTIHKSQGLTLDFVDIDLSNCFSAGQAYVALSRARTLEGLRLRGWNKTSVAADPKVLKFYNF